MALRRAARACVSAALRVEAGPASSWSAARHAAPLPSPPAPPRHHQHRWQQQQQRRGFACRTKFDAPPPKMVFVEYDPADVDSFIAVADEIEAAFGDVQVEGNVEGVSPRAGAFEVTADGGALLFSKLRAARLPRSDEVVDAIRMGGVPAAGTAFPAPGSGGCS